MFYVLGASSDLSNIKH